MKRAVALFALLFALCLSSAQAGLKRAMTFDDILAVKNISDAQVSPDGRSRRFLSSRLRAAKPNA